MLGLIGRAIIGSAAAYGIVKFVKEKKLVERTVAKATEIGDKILTKVDEVTTVNNENAWAQAANEQRVRDQSIFDRAIAEAREAFEKHQVPSSVDEFLNDPTTGTTRQRPQGVGQ